MREYKSKNKNIILSTTIDTPLGLMFCAASSKGIVLLSYFTKFNIEARIDTLKKTLDADVIPGESPYFKSLRIQLNEYFNKKRQSFELPMQLIGSSFQVEVYKELLKLNYGKNITLEELALKLNIKSKKALQSPCVQNMLNIIVPCHRVVDKDFNLYAGGLDKKKFLLNLEKEKNEINCPSNKN